MIIQARGLTVDYEDGLSPTTNPRFIGMYLDHYVDSQHGCDRKAQPIWTTDGDVKIHVSDSHHSG